MLGALKQEFRKFGPGYRAFARLKGVRLHEPTIRTRRIDVLGSDYGGWGCDLSLLDGDSIVYGVGVGEDLTFDLELIEATGCMVFGFDPTPRSVAWVASRRLPAKFHFHQIGLGAEDGEVEFHPPAREGHVSFSRNRGEDEGGAAVKCPIRRLQTLMGELGHARIDLLKMDIEGFEYEVIDDIVASAIRPRQLLAEFHHGMYGHSADETRAAVGKLLRHGYAIAWVSDVGREYNFVDISQAG